LIAARAVQGVGAAMLVPGSLALISATFPRRNGAGLRYLGRLQRHHLRAGPLLGGFLIDRLSWAWAFAVNVPLAALVLGITWLHVPESRRAGCAATLDCAGRGAGQRASGGIVYFFIEAPGQGWGALPVLLALATGAVALAHSSSSSAQAAPMLPPALLRNAQLRRRQPADAAAVCGARRRPVLPAAEPDPGAGLSATAAGAALLPFILIMFVLSRWAGGLVDRRGARGPLIIGPLHRGSRLRAAGAARNVGIELLDAASCPASRCWASAWRSPWRR
jgi:hypothetical protein